MFNFFNRSKKDEAMPLWFETDVHCHLVPGVDDGSPDVETSVSLVEGLHSLGINRIVTTPHVAAVEFPNTVPVLDAAFDTLGRALKERHVDVPVVRSAEYRIDEDLPGLISGGGLTPFPGGYVLIENGWIQEPMDLEQIIFDLQIKGYRPIMAHPERFTYYHRNPGRWDALHDKIPFQVNLLSLAGHYGKDVKRAAQHMVDKGYVDYLGSDTHRMEHIEVLRGYLSGSDARRHRKATSGRLRNDRLKF